MPQGTGNRNAPGLPRSPLLSGFNQRHARILFEFQRYTLGVQVFYSFGDKLERKCCKQYTRELVCVFHRHGDEKIDFAFFVLQCFDWHRCRFVTHTLIHVCRRITAKEFLLDPFITPVLHRQQTGQKHIRQGILQHPVHRHHGRLTFSDRFEYGGSGGSEANQFRLALHHSADIFLHGFSHQSG